MGIPQAGERATTIPVWLETAPAGKHKKMGSNECSPDFFWPYCTVKDSVGAGFAACGDPVTVIV